MEELDKQKIEFFNQELNKINNTLSARSEGLGSLLTIASLLSFLPTLNFGQCYFNHFLIWTLPFLLIAIFTYYRASWRVSSVVKGRGFASEGTHDASVILNNQVKYLEIVWRKALANHDTVMKWYSWTQGLIYAYISSAIVSLYIFVFYGEPDQFLPQLVVILSCGVGTVFYLWPKSYSEKNRVID